MQVCIDLETWLRGVSLALKGSVLQQLCETTWDNLGSSLVGTLLLPLTATAFPSELVSLLTGWRWMPQDVTPRSLSAMTGS